MKRQNKRFRASMTIEAAVVVPITMVILTAVIYLAFFVHDQAVMTAVNDYTALEQAGNSRNAERSALLYSATGGSPSVSAGNGTVRAVSEGIFQLPLSYMERLFDERTKALHSEVELTFLDSRRKLLLYKSICDGVPKLLKGAVSGG